jgi:biotin carboxyl carrier protein
MEFEFLVGDEARKISLEKKGGVFIVRDGAGVFEADIRQVSDNELSVLAGGHSFKVFLARDRSRRLIFLGGRTFAISDSAEKSSRFIKGDERTLEGGLQVKAPMPGKVIKILVGEGETVRKNQTLAIVEAMKMENEIKSSLEAVVKKICAAAGDLVDSEKPLIELEEKK